MGKAGKVPWDWDCVMLSISEKNIIDRRVSQWYEWRDAEEEIP